MAWILVALLLIIAAVLGTVLLRLRTSFATEVAAAGDLRRERDAAISAGDALSAQVAALDAKASPPVAGVPRGEGTAEAEAVAAGKGEAAGEAVAAGEGEAVEAGEAPTGVPEGEATPEAGEAATGVPEGEATPEAGEAATGVPEAAAGGEAAAGVAEAVAHEAVAPATGVPGGDAAPEPVIDADVARGEAASEPDVEVRLGALWALAQIEQQRTWRLSMAAGVEGDPGLAGALAMEVDRIREEVGTPGSLAARLDSPVAVNDAALTLLAARELLAALVPHTQAYDMTLAQDGSRLTVEVICTGWEGPAAAADDVSKLLAAIAPAGGDLSLDTDADGRLRATMQLPQGG